MCSTPQFLSLPLPILPPQPGKLPLLIARIPCTSVLGQSVLPGNTLNLRLPGCCLSMS